MGVARQPRLLTAAPAALLAAGALLVYLRTFSAPFVYDDFASIAENPTIRSLGSALFPPPASGAGGRPLLNLSYALNFAAGGTAVFGYHLVNLAIHAAAGCVLFGLIRRTLRLPGMADRFGRDATALALAAAAIWSWHPVQTQSVTYLSQRAESMMGLWYLLCLYCFARGWKGGCIACCALGMAAKETMVTAPLVVLLYDRTWVAGSWAEAWRRHRSLYLGLGATWALAAFLLAGVSARGAGFSGPVGPGIYALTEARAWVTYLALAFWPHPLIFDRGDLWVRNVGEVGWQLLAVAGLVALTVWALRRRPALGFGLACFLLVLAPTSSIIPIAGQPIAENRLYLPLAAVVAVAVVGCYRWWGRRIFWVAPLVAVAFAAAAYRRNEDYRSAAALWRDTARKCPANARAHNNLGQVLLAGGNSRDLPEAAAEMRTALRIAPGISNAAEIHNNLGDALSRMGRADEAAGELNEALRLKPGFAVAHYNLGNVDASAGRTREAAGHYEAAIRLQPGYAPAHNNLAKADHALGRDSDALEEAATAVRLDPDFVEARFNLGCALLAAGKPAEAAAAFEHVLRLQPNFPGARDLLGRAEAMPR